MLQRQLGESGLKISPIVFGGNVFGWTADETISFRLLDEFVDQGFNLIDTADVYSAWAPGNHGGESETIIGRWLRKSRKRERVLIATKVGHAIVPESRGLKRANILKCVEASLKRLQIDSIDLYQTHVDDLSTPVEETLRTFHELVKSGKVRAIGASQYTASRLRESLAFSRANGITAYTSLQPLYNLYDRQGFETELAPVCRDFNLGVIPFYSLAAGFLTGKYRNEADLTKSVRGPGTVRDKYLNPRGLSLLKAMDAVAKKCGAAHSSIALAWMLSNPVVTAPIASATSLDQLKDLIKAPDLKLTTEDLQTLNAASAP